MFFRKKEVGPEYYFERGEDCLKRGDYHWAMVSFSKAIEFKPDYEMAYHRRAEAYKGLGKTREAVWDYIKFLEVDHRMPGMAGDFKEAVKESINIARMDWQRDRVKDEIISFGVPALLDELMEGYDPEGEYSDTRFYDLALSWLERSPGENRHYVGFVLLLKGDFDKAIREFDEAIKEDPKNPNTYYFNGVTLLKKMKKFKPMRRMRKVEELSEMARMNFEQAMKKGFEWRVCPECGYRTPSKTNFCMRCGEKLLVG
jgi:tetratricopeptide (TPR) repeat protein